MLAWVLQAERSSRLVRVSDAGLVFPVHRPLARAAPSGRSREPKAIRPNRPRLG